jgi:hypothetical protein
MHVSCLVYRVDVNLNDIWQVAQNTGHASVGVGRGAVRRNAGSRDGGRGGGGGLLDCY